MHHLCWLLCVCALLLPISAPLHARSANQQHHTPLQVTATTDGVTIEWHGTPDPQATLPTLHYAGYELPAELVALRVFHTRAVTPTITTLRSAPWAGTLPQYAPAVPQPIDGAPRPALARSAPATLPASPVFVLRDSTVRGARIVVLAVSPFFTHDGVPHLARRMQATIANATLIEPDRAAAGALQQRFAPRSAPTAEAAPTVPTPAQAQHRLFLPLVIDYDPRVRELAPPNTHAATAAFKIHVTRPGMQELTGAMLAAQGIDLATLDAAQLQVWQNGVQIPLEERGITTGQMEPGDVVRFYAPAPGDRWNTAMTYWLVIDPTPPALRMDGRAAGPPDAPARTFGHTTGTWSQPTLYDSTLPGVDGDHWFSTDLRSGPGLDAAELRISLNPPPLLVPDSATLTLGGSAYTRGPHQLEVEMGTNRQVVTWSGIGAWQQQVSFTQDMQSAIVVRLLPGTAPSGVLLDAVAWEMPIALDATGGAGLTFRGSAAPARYLITQVMPGDTLYDITDPLRPVRLSTAMTETLSWSATAAQRSYLLAGTETLHTPEITAHVPRDLSQPLNADVLYIAPAAFHADLQPLVEQRQHQGYQVQVVDVQAIYDAWSYGQVDPEAIRSFLRYASVAGSTPPIAVTLVGDGTSDPHNYRGRNNQNFIPPYLAYVDPWLGETACEPCYAQLDGAAPLDDALPDVLLGRLPVKSAAELRTVVSKIIGYETGAPNEPWRNRAIYLTDNADEADGSPDPAGNFIADADASIALQPATLTIARLSYDPSPDQHLAPWREPDHVRARDRTSALLSQGAGLVTYFGHSHHWQWGLTALGREPSHLIELFEVDRLRNGSKLPVILAMTCFSSSFHEPAYSGTTIDERLVLHADGGAIAVWGPTGQGVAFGHQELQRGFYQELWQGATPGQAPVGVLAQAGYGELFRRGNCCQSVLRTYALLGDPLTQVRVHE